MSQKSTINLTNNQLNLISDTNYPIEKLKALQNIKLLLQQTADCIMQHNECKPFIFGVAAKLTHGENYLQLPYIIIDIPQLTSNKPHLNARVMFWWGNYFACQYFINQKILYQFNLHDFIKHMADDAVFITDNLWDNNIHSASWLKTTANETQKQEQFLQADIIKICAIMPILAYKNLPHFALNFYLKIFSWLNGVIKYQLLR